MKQSNPIQQRMDLLVDKWEAIVAKPNVNIIRIHAQENEKNMVNAFYTYLLGVDTQNHDVPVIFESIYYDDDQYTQSTLNELKKLIDTWNNANRDNISIPLETINWSPDLKYKNNDHAAALFTQNMNNLAAYLNLADKTYLVAILKVSFIQPSQFCRWLEHALKAGMSKKFKILIDDSSSNPFYDNITTKYPENIITLEPQLDMDTAMQQVAAMGDPNDAGVQYRQSFIKMMQSIAKRKETEAFNHGQICIDIAEKNLAKNGFWIGQIIAVYTALANDQIGYRNFKKAILFATKGVEAAERSQQLIPDEFMNRKFRAQAVMTRASLYIADKNWQNAIADFSTAANHYEYTNDLILALEAYRMMAYAHNKNGNNDAACKALNKALFFALKLPPHIIQFTTFPAVIEMLLEINNQKYISQQEVQEAAEFVYGKEWLKEIKNWKNPRYEQVSDPRKTVAAR